MDDMLSKAKYVLKTDPKLADLIVREERGELHLFRGDDRGQDGPGVVSDALGKHRL